jgi:protein-S-isoprenylcysteine O-methyltransferase Ste14
MGHRRYEDRVDLVDEHPFGDTGQLILLGVFSVVWILDSLFLKWTTFLARYVPWYIRTPVGVIFLCLAGYLAQNGLKIIFGQVRDKPEIVKKGVFGIVRHPIYLGSILFYFGMVLFSFSILSAVVWIVIIVFYHYISKYEENSHVKVHGSAYKKYMTEVPMWIPRIFKSSRKLHNNLYHHLYIILSFCQLTK